MFARTSRIVGLVAVVLSSTNVAAQDADRRIEIEVRDGPASDRAAPVRLVVPLPVEGTSTIRTQAGPAHYRVSVHAEGAERDVLRFDVQRSVPGSDRARGGGAGDVSLSVSVVPRTGRRFVLARLERPDGTVTLITARVTTVSRGGQRDSG